MYLTFILLNKMSDRSLNKIQVKHIEVQKETENFYFISKEDRCSHTRYRERIPKSEFEVFNSFYGDYYYFTNDDDTAVEKFKRGMQNHFEHLITSHKESISELNKDLKSLNVIPVEIVK